MRYDRFNGNLHLRSETGAVLLVLLLIILGGISCLLVRILAVNPLIETRQYRTESALNRAREALLGYAVSYPDKINPDYGPGYLPCPDRNNDGATDGGGCSLAGHTSIGRFPYKTLEMERLRDGHGESLWYVIADNFRNNPKLEPLNSDVTGNLTVNTMNDIAAIIIAPGTPLASQDRNLAPNDIANFLENENADFDAVFVTRDPDAGNDRLVFITRQELMQAVEKRVLGEISGRFRQYQSMYHAFPWLSPYQNPAISGFHAQLDTESTPKKGWQGHIAFHPFSWTSRPSQTSGVNPYLTDIRWSWSEIVDAVVDVYGTVDESCVVSLDCKAGPFQNVSELASETPVQCIWTVKESVDCEPASISLYAGYDYPPAAGCGGGTITRTYATNFPPFSGVITIHDPGTMSYRTREVTLNGVIPPETDAVQITDEYNGPVSSDCIPGTLIVGTGRMSFTINTTGNLRAANIHYDLDVQSGEMPEWVFKNDWHKLVYVAYAEAEPLPGSASSTCTAEIDCLVLNGTGSPLHSNRALVIIAGHALQDGLRPSSQLGAYFESANSIFDETFEKYVISDAFNDQIMVIATP